MFENVSNETKVFGLKVNSHHVFFLGILLSLSILFSSPVFFTKDRVYTLNLSGLKSVPVKDLKLNILAKNVIFNSAASRGQKVYCDLKYDISFGTDIKQVTVGEEYIYPVMAFIDSNKIEYTASYQDVDCNTAQDEKRAKSVLRIME